MAEVVAGDGRHPISNMAEIDFDEHIIFFLSMSLRSQHLLLSKYGIKRQIMFCQLMNGHAYSIIIVWRLPPTSNSTRMSKLYIIYLTLISFFFSLSLVVNGSILYVYPYRQCQGIWWGEIVWLVWGLNDEENMWGYQEALFTTRIIVEHVDWRDTREMSTLRISNLS